MSDPGPVTGAERIGSLDVLRGVAILGILAKMPRMAMMPMIWQSLPPLASWQGCQGWQGL